MHDNDNAAVMLLETKIREMLAPEQHSNDDCAGILKLFHAREYLQDAESEFERARR